MKIWHDEDGVEFKNSDVCFGREYNPDCGKIDVAKIYIRGCFPERGWGWLEESHEMAVIVRGEGFIQLKGEDPQKLSAGDVVYIESMQKFCWGGDMDMIVSCGPAFEPGKHHLEEGEV